MKYWISKYYLITIMLLACTVNFSFGQNYDSLAQQLLIDIDYNSPKFKKAVPLIPIEEDKGGIPTWAWIIPTAGGGAGLIYILTRDDEPVDINLIATTDNVSIPCNGQSNINVLTNDSGDNIQFQSFTNPSTGAVTHEGNGNLSIAVGTQSFSFTYTIIDADGNTASATVNVNVLTQPINGGDDEFTFLPETPVSGNVLTNDSGENLMLTGNTQPQNGSLNISTDGSFTYTPNIDFCGQDDFSYTITDECGQEASATVTFTSEDSTPPTITCPDSSMTSCNESTDPSVTGQAEATDDCTPNEEISITFIDDESGLTECNNTGVIVRTWTATDLAGNATTCTQQIEVVDNDAPTIVCPENIVVQCGDNTDPASTGMPDVDDLCGSVSLEYDDTVSGDGCDFNFEITRRWTATDACGNQSICEQQITIEADMEIPSLSIPSNVNINCGSSTEPSETGTATAEDNCTSSADIVIEYSDAQTGDGCGTNIEITRTWTATDECGNVSSADQTITVEADADSPILTIPADLNLNCGASIEPSETGIATAEDNCTLPENILIEYSDTVTGDGCSSNTEITRTWMATDECGNVSTADQIITVEADADSPILTIPADLNLNCGASTDPTETGTATAEDNCTLPENILIEYSDTITGDGCSSNTEITRTWMATDECGNVSTSDQLIVVEADLDTPQLSAPADLNLTCGDSTDPPETGTATAEDNCTSAENIMIEYSDVQTGDGCGENLQITRTWSAIDACGNISQQDQIIIFAADLTVPTLSCPADIVISCEDQPDPELTGAPIAEDNCSSFSDLLIEFEDVISNPSSCTTEISRTWTVTDLCGNASTCMQTIIQEDINPPIISCADHVIIPCTQEADPEMTGFATAIDDCSGNIVVDFSDVFVGEGCTGELIRTWTAIDECGNTSSCDQIITLAEVPCDFNIGVITENADCGISNGIGQVIITPGPNAVGPFEITWSDGITGLINENLSPGAGNVTVSDLILNCEQSLPFSIGQDPPAYLNNLSIIPVGCGSNGDIILDLVSSGNGPMNVSLIFPGGGFFGVGGIPLGAPVVLSDFFNMPPAGEYLFMVYDESIGNICTQTFPVLLPQIDPYPLLIDNIVNPSSETSNDGQIFLTIGNPAAIPPYTVLFNGMNIGTVNSLSFLINFVPAGIHEIQVIDALGCPTEVIVVEMFPDGGTGGLNFSIPGLSPSNIISENQSLKWLPGKEQPLNPNPTDQWIELHLTPVQKMSFTVSKALYKNLSLNIETDYESGHVGFEDQSIQTQFYLKDPKYSSIALTPNLSYTLSNHNIWKPYLAVGVRMSNIDVFGASNHSAPIAQNQNTNELDESDLHLTVELGGKLNIQNNYFIDLRWRPEYLGLKRQSTFFIDLNIRLPDTSPKFNSMAGESLFLPKVK